MEAQKECKKCLNLCKHSVKFCGMCGNQFPIVNLQTVARQKEKERMSLFGQKKKLKQIKLTTSTPLPKPTKTVTINVGIMKADGEGWLKKVRGVWATISVDIQADAKKILTKAIEKHASMDQYFNEFKDYVLLYPDMKLCKLLPGRNEEFTIEKYKCFLNKPYSKVTLFVCLEKSFLDLVEEPNAMETRPTSQRNSPEPLNIGGSGSNIFGEELNNYNEAVEDNLSANENQSASLQSYGGGSS